MITNTWLLWGIVVGWAGFAIWLGNNTKWGRFLGNVNLSIFGGIILVNLGAVPMSNAVYSTVMGYFIPIAIVLMLFMADLKQLLRCGPKMIAAMATMIVIAVVCTTAVGVVFSYSDMSWKLWASAGANFIGNMQTFAGVAASIGLEGSDMALFAGGGVPAWTLYSLGCYLVGRSFIARFLGSYKDGESGVKFSQEEKAKAMEALNQGAASVTLNETAAVIGAAVLVAAVGNWLASVTGFYAIVFYAAIAVICANFTPISKYKVNEQLATVFFCMYMFTLGCNAHWSTFISGKWQIIVGVFVYYVVSAVVLILVSKLFRFPWEYSLLAHMAASGGPISTPPLAKYYGLNDLVLPSVIIAVLGQVAGSYGGLLIGQLIRMFGG